MRRAIVILLSVAFVAGCAARSVLVGGDSKPVREANAEEIRVAEIARKAVTAREGTRGHSWADRGTYDVRRQTNGWLVGVFKTDRDLFGRPVGYPLHCNRWIKIDEQGKVTDYQ